MEIPKEIKKIIPAFRAYPEIKLVYFFGSRAKNNAGPLSDYDFAVYFGKQDKKRMFEIKFELQDKISRKLKNNNVDIVILNAVESPEMKFSIIKEGKLIVEREPFKLLVEPKIFNEYFDFHALLRYHNLTKTRL